jgi:uracil-DNA glycosylase family 4
MQQNPNCELCSLHETAQHVCVFGIGPKQCDIMIVMGAVTLEGKTGKALGGQGGSLLRASLNKAGIDASKGYVTSMVKCRPPDNRAPTNPEFKSCRPYIEHEIESVNPKFIMLVGAEPLKLIKKTGITTLRGSVFEIDGRVYFPIFSPGAILRDPGKQAGFDADIAKFSRLVAGELETDPDAIPFKFVTPDTLDEFYREFRETKVFSFDIETTGLIQHAPDFRANSIGYTFDTDSTWVLGINIDPQARDYAEGKYVNWARKVIRTTEVIAQKKRCVGHNGKFDVIGIMEEVGIRYHLTDDTMLASHTFDENTPHDLKYLAKVECGAPDYDDLTLSQKLDPVGKNCLDQFFQYQADDAYWTMQLHKKYSARFKETFKLRRLYSNLIMPAARIFEEIDYSGLFINLERFELAREKLKAAIVENERDLNNMYGGRKKVNWGSPAQVADVLFKKLKLPVIEKTPTGKPGTGESVLLELQGMHPIADKLIEWRGNQKNLNTYIEGWEPLMIGPMLYLSTKLHGTVTGRYSSRLHQVPRDELIRSLIDAPEGYTFVCADFSQIELRLAAHIAHEAHMIDIFRKGGDIHKTTAQWVMMTDGEPTKEQRKSAKGVNFGYLYGMGWRKFRKYAKEKYGAIFTDQTAKDAREAYYLLYPGLLPWHERVRETVREQGYMEYLSGRLRRLPGVFSSDSEARAEAERQAINSPVQGFGSGDLKAMAIVGIREHFGQTPKLILKGEVHDSILMWIRNDVLHEYMPVVKAIMENPPLLQKFKIHLDVPLIADVEYGPWSQGKKFELTS